jgi:hypothetical protein
MGVLEGVAIDSLKFQLRSPGLPFYVGGRPAAVFYPFGRPTPNAYGGNGGKARGDVGESHGQADHVKKQHY